MAAPRWLLLAHQLPTRPSNARVKTWRRLQQIGAVPTRNSVYVLPNTDACREDFEWMRSEIVALGGEATVFAADAVNPDGEEEIVAAFQRAREADYRALKRDLDRLLAAKGRRAAAPAGRDSLGRAVRTLRERFNEIERIDFSRAKGRQEAAAALAALERQSAPREGPPAGRAAPRLAPADFQRRRWVTRPRPGVDRMASAWLIRRFIDPRATFAFVDSPAPSDVPFDMYVGEFSHQGALCTFETLVDCFAVDDPAVARLGQIVHDLDMKEARYAPPEAPAVGRMVDGLRRLHADDHALLDQGMAMFEALARSFDASDGFPARSTRARGRRAKTRLR